MKKIISALLIIAMIMSLAGCGGKSDKPNSDSQTVSDTQKEDTGVETDDEKASETTDQSTEKEPGETSLENNAPAGSIEELNAQVEKDIVDTLAALTKEYAQLKTDIDTYDKYAKNVDKVESFYDKVNQTHKELCIRMYEYSVTYAEKTLSSDTSNDEKYDELEELYDNVYDDGGDAIYDGFYDGILENVYEDFYDGILDDAQDTAEYSEWLDYRSQEYEWWLDTRSDVYEQWLDCRSDVYEFWLDLRIEVYSGDIDKANEVISDFKDDIAKLKEKN